MRGDALTTACLYIVQLLPQTRQVDCKNIDLFGSKRRQKIDTVQPRNDRSLFHGYLAARIPVDGCRQPQMLSKLTRRLFAC